MLYPLNLVSVGNLEKGGALDFRTRGIEVQAGLRVKSCFVRLRQRQDLTLDLVRGS